MNMLLALKNIVLALLLASVVFEVVVLSPRELADQSNVKLFRHTDDARQFDRIVSDLHLVEVKQEKLEWEVWSNRADKKTGVEAWALDQVRSRFYGIDNVQYTVVGNQGTVSENRSNMEIHGNVETTSTEGFLFKTESMKYDPTQRMLYSAGAVDMRGPDDKDGAGMILTGVGLKAFLTEHRVEIEHEVLAHKVIKGGHKVSIKSDQALFLNKERIARFTGKVHIVYDQMKIDGPVAEFHLKKDSNTLEELIMNQGVVAQDGLRKAKSQVLKVYFEEQKVVFDGKPKVEQGEDVLVGDQIIFLEGGDRVQVVNAKAKFEPNDAKKKNDPNKGPKTQ